MVAWKKNLLAVVLLGVGIGGTEWVISTYQDAWFGGKKEPQPPHTPLTTEDSRQEEGKSRNGENPVFAEDPLPTERRLIARPMAQFYAMEAPHHPIPLTQHAAPVPFVVYYGTEADSEGFYPVKLRPEDAEPFAMLKKEEVYAWPLNLLVNYKNPQRDAETGKKVAKARRRAALYFDGRDKVFNFVTNLSAHQRDELTEEAQAAFLDKLNGGNAAQQLHQREGIVAIEPAAWSADLVERNLPVIDFDACDERNEGYVYKAPRSGSEIRTKLLQVAAMVKQEKAETVKKATDKKTVELATQREALKVDVVFLVDTTASMKPYMDAMKGFMNHVYDELQKACEGNGDTGAVGDVQFGIVAYRDWLPAKDKATGKTSIRPVCDYIARPYDLTGDAAQFRRYVEELKNETKVTDDDFYEDMPYGLSVALNYGEEKISWRTMSDGKPSLRFIIQLGDAPYRDPSISDRKGRGSSRLKDGAMWAGKEGSPVSTSEIREYLQGGQHAVALMMVSIIDPALSPKLKKMGLSDTDYFMDLGYQAKLLSFAEPIFLAADSVFGGEASIRDFTDILKNTIGEKSLYNDQIQDTSTVGSVENFMNSSGEDLGKGVAHPETMQQMDESELSPMQKIFRAAYVNWLADSRPTEEDGAALSGVTGQKAGHAPADMVGWTFGTDDDDLSIDTMVALTQPQVQQLVESIRAYLAALEEEETDEESVNDFSLVGAIAGLQSDPNVGAAGNDSQDMKAALQTLIGKLPYRSQMLHKFMNEDDTIDTRRLRRVADALERRYLNAAEKGERNKPIFVPIIDLP